MNLDGKLVLITGAARRIGKSMALAVAQAGADIIIHHGHSQTQAEQVKNEIRSLGKQAYIIQADLNDTEKTRELMDQAWSIGPIYALVNNASIFGSIDLFDTTITAWNQHLNINLTAPFILCQSFAQKIIPDQQGRIVNILDWRAQRPGPDHLPYTISKAALAALTQSLAVSLAPNVNVNALAFGAILPPSDGGQTENILANVPAARWAELQEVNDALLFLLAGPSYITGEIIHLDGGRHLV
jgi:NAD(P)-dependent dehydrogenase (short-subunit alcohol dehydrogenase family)